ncbi:C-type lectin protein [Lophiotrema nucula]|uniref:C-type lectin protein n=1 Tax=Lophiotrema nucula TaxID=690887 RepID=A0A6A5ZQC5_9PLEO|nr:C-type lectin protein [Lophiotrema nucula]
MTVSGRTPIIDIRVGPTEFDILQDIKKGLRPENGGEKRLPTLLLYDEAGLRWFEKITYLDEYYLTNAEIEVLEKYADDIAQRIQAGSVVVELGSGNLRKVNILLQAIDRLGKDVEYYAVDLSLPELKRTFAEIPTEGYKHIKCFGLYGTYDQALAWLKSPNIIEKPKTILWLGSSLGNFKREELPPFLSGFRDAIGEGDTMLIGIDSCKDPNRVYHAYNDRDGTTHAFIHNGLKHANRITGENTFNLDDWEVIGEYDQVAGRHHAFVSPNKEVAIDGVTIAKGERLRIEESYKWSRDEILKLWETAGLAENSVWSNERSDYGLHFISKPKVSFPIEPEGYAATSAPSLADWRLIWAAWDVVTRGMIPDEELLSKPIKLRNACIFYLGHIPTFLDIHLSRATGDKPTEPVYYRKIFERGIDPDVENPEQCHTHSEVPDTWPLLEEILSFQDSVRAKVKDLYSSGAATKDRKISRAMWIAFEHEAMHLETLLYMLIQSERISAPIGVTVPDFKALAERSNTLAVENQWFTIPEQDITIGLKDIETDNGYDAGPDRYYGWDNEKPQRSAHVPSFQAKARPITNGEYAEYLLKTGKSAIPASWCESMSAGNGTIHRRSDSVLNGTNGNANETNGASRNLTEGKFVRTVYGTVPLKYALDWPVVASYDELVGCAQWMGGRIPTVEEVRSIYAYVERTKSKEFGKALGKTIPAVNSHLVNDGVEESPPSRGSVNGASNIGAHLNPTDLFIDLEGANVGFQHWHPVSVVEKGGQLCGQADLGGVWEWTSSVLEKHEGFRAMELYPLYTADFFDGKHNITLGGSWATHPRMAGRKTFVNWYQRSYPYVWAGARLVRD